MAGTVSWTFLFLMTLTDLRRTGQTFSRMSPDLDLSHVLLVVKPG